MQDLYEIRKEMDSEITPQFLSNNEDTVKKMVEAFADAIKACPYKERMYLKGGNGLAMLEQMSSGVSGGMENFKLTGDYDFQFQPTKEAYADWNNKFPEIRDGILNALRQAADLHNGAEETNPEESDAEENATIEINTDAFFKEKDYEEEVKIPGARKDKLTFHRGEIDSRIMYIGEEYQCKTYCDLISDPRMKNGRIEYDEMEEWEPGKKSGMITCLDKTESVEKKSACDPFTIYVNYTIPGFILFRLVMRCVYTVEGLPGGEKTVPLKSEIIDVSVPRQGSAEVLLSQDKVITHFIENTGETYDIPGWGYHFYENINLLQEISLGISGSKQKQAKREERLRKVCDVLIAANQPSDEKVKKAEEEGKKAEYLAKNKGYRVLFKEEINEPGLGKEALTQKICGYAGALAQNAQTYGIIDEKLLAAFRKRWQEELRSDFVTFTSQAKEMQDLCAAFTGYHLGWNDNAKCVIDTSANFLDSLGEKLGGYGFWKTECLMPFELLKGKNYVLPFTFIPVICKKDMASPNIYLNKLESDNSDDKNTDKDRYLIVENYQGKKYYILVWLETNLPGEEEKKSWKVPLGDILQNTILLSQRYVLEQAYYDGANKAK